jgi:hypothetical protein
MKNPNLSILSREQKQALYEARKAEETVNVASWQDVMTLECGHTISALQKATINETLYYFCSACRIQREIIEERVFMAAKSTRDAARLRNEAYRTHAMQDVRIPNLCPTNFKCLCEALHQNCDACVAGRYKKCTCHKEQWTKVNSHYFTIVEGEGGRRVIDTVLWIRDGREHVYETGSRRKCEAFIEMMVKHYASKAAR